MSVKNVFILGTEGKTGKAVTERLKNLADYQQVTDLAKADLIVVSPGISPDKYPKVNIPIISEIEFAFLLNPSPIIAISGTNAKSTTTAKIAHMLKVPYAGNIGVPYISKTAVYPYLSVEVSSYQLFATKSFKPKISVLLNVSPDHLQWHGSFENYLAAKAKIFANQDQTDFLVYNSQDIYLQEIVKTARCQLVAFTAKNKFDQSQQAAAKVWEIIHPDNPQGFELAISDFQGLEHRFEKVGEFFGITVINDSKATNPESTIAALESFEPKSDLIIILGGREKGTDLGELKAQLKDKARKIVLTGESLPNFAKSFAELDIYSEPDFEKAVNYSLSIARPNSTVLLSPAAASFDNFTCFEQRGERFKQIVRQFYQK